MPNNPLPLSYATTTALSLSNLVLVSPRQTIGYQPKNDKFKRGSEPAPLLFQYEGENSFEMAADITDHFVEDNTTRQDQIAIRPEQVTVNGFIGEVNNVVPESLRFLKLAAEKLLVISAYVPELTTTALLAYDTAFQVYQAADTAIDSAVGSWESLSGQAGLNVIGSTGIEGFDENTGNISGNQNKQQIAFQQFYGYMRKKTLFRVQTPWAVLDDMAISNLRAVQDSETRTVSNFFVTFKKIRIATTQTTTSIDASHQTRSRAQATPVTNIGPTQPTPSIGLSDALANVA